VYTLRQRSFKSDRTTLHKNLRIRAV
jgi:hypothetical protein